MFSGIIEQTGTVRSILSSGSNLTFIIEAPFAHELKVDQSVAHNGVCLTVEKIIEGAYQVTAVEETLKKTNLSRLKEKDVVNLERSLTLNQLIDGHIVQGHVDTVGTCTGKEERDGSWLFHFSFPEAFASLIVEKGSIAINGVSLTAFNCGIKEFSVTIIPYTYQHTGFHRLQPGEPVNLEFDIVGKYIARQAALYSQK